MQPHEHDQGMWLEDASGQWSWFEVSQPHVSMNGNLEGNGKDRGGKVGAGTGSDKSPCDGKTNWRDNGGH